MNRSQRRTLLAGFLVFVVSAEMSAAHAQSSFVPCPSPGQGAKDDGPPASDGSSGVPARRADAVLPDRGSGLMAVRLHPRNFLGDRTRMLQVGAIIAVLAIYILVRR